MKKFNVLFRADGSNQIGLGHIYRCLGISERIKKNFNCYFAVRELSEELKELLTHSAKIIELENYEDYHLEAEFIALKLIPRYQIDIVTLDGYNFDTDYQKVLKEKSEAVIISIDDNQPFHYVSDAVINHAGGIDESKISREPYTKLLLGHDYLLLRKEFFNAPETSKKIAGIHSVLLCFGGADPDNFTQKVVNFLKNSNFKVTIIVGALYNQLETLMQSIVDDSNMKVLNNLNADSIKEIMDTSDIAIVPSSTMGLEAFVSNMIVITGMTAENQRNIYKGLVKEDTVIGISSFSELSRSYLLEQMKKASEKFTNYLFISKNEHNDNILNLYNSLK